MARGPGDPVGWLRAALAGGPQRALPVHIDARVLREIRRLAAEARPYELCGLLRAVSDARGSEVRGARVLPNRAASPMAGFRLDAADVSRTRAEWARDRRGVLGVFHSHGACDATPSAHDRATMRRHPGVHMIIGQGGDVRVFSHGEDGLRERALRVSRTPSTRLRARRVRAR